MMDGNVTLTNTNIAENENVVMLYNGKYYGPYKAKRRIGDGKYYIKPDITNYLVPFIRTSKFSVLSLKSSRIMMIRQRHSLYMRQVPGNRLTLFRTRSCWKVYLRIFHWNQQPKARTNLSTAIWICLLYPHFLTALHRKDWKGCKGSFLTQRLFWYKAGAVEQFAEITSGYGKQSV